MGFCIQVNGSASEDKASEALRREIGNYGLAMIFIVDKWARIVNEVDANPRNGTQVFEVRLGGIVLLFIRKAGEFRHCGEPNGE
jgi:hypothetical protein